MSFIHDDFMLGNETGRRLFHNYAEKMPIIDYHCHLDPKIIAEDHQFRNITELFLGGDHYKWRAMRSNGVDERYITGDAPDREKFQKWAETMPYLLGNPLYHWTHLELKRYFDIDEVLCPDTAEMIWNRCNALLAKEEFSARNLILRSNVKVICTTDDPADSLCYHQKLKAEGFPVRVLPTFRPDKAVNVDLETFVPYMQTLGVSSYDALIATLQDKIDYFHQNGCRLSDHALDVIPYATGDPSKVFEKAMHARPSPKRRPTALKRPLSRHVPKSMRHWAGRCSCISAQCGIIIKKCIRHWAPIPAMIRSTICRLQSRWRCLWTHWSAKTPCQRRSFIP